MTVAPAAQLSQETLALTKRLFVQLQRRPSTLVAGIAFLFSSISKLN